MSEPLSTRPRSRRAWVLIAIVALGLTFGLWLAATVKKSPLTRTFGGRKVPQVLAGRDLPEADERRVTREDDNDAVVRCEFDGEGTPGTLVAMAEGEVLSSGSDLSLRLPPGTWSVYWRADESTAVQLGRLDAEAGDVETCRLGAEGWRVSGTVQNLDGQPLVDTSVYVCGHRARTSDSGTFVGYSQTATCSVRALYQDGILTRRSEPVVVSAFDAREVDLVVDDAPIAGMGIAFRMRARGARVNMIHPGTPAEEAGLEVGDIITSIDGKATAGLSDDAFITLGTGREGSRVVLEVERDGEPRSFSFFRERLDAVDTG
ncbi:MAG: PDZ domain-containing protein [Pseudomonadota bacterium]|nr:PDZ domain-containing protein [Pseudomonadota bacterium]